MLMKTKERTNKVEIKEIKTVIDLMTKNSLTEFELEKGDFKIRIKKGDGSFAITAVPPIVTPPAVSVSTPSIAAPQSPSSDLPSINSPMVGTFYSAPSPDSPAYVKVGDPVQEDTVVCIIEAMKVMNEIKAETKGVISEILVENAKPVEFGKPLFRIQPQ